MMVAGCLHAVAGGAPRRLLLYVVGKRLRRRYRVESLVKFKNRDSHIGDLYE